MALPYGVPASLTVSGKDERQVLALPYGVPASLSVTGNVERQVLALPYGVPASLTVSGNVGRVSNSVPVLFELTPSSTGRLYIGLEEPNSWSGTATSLNLRFTLVTPSAYVLYVYIHSYTVVNQTIYRLC